MRQLILLFLLLTALTPLAPAEARSRSADKSVRAPRVKFEEYRLPNGLRVLLAPDKSAPVIALSVTYDVAARNERPGRSGFAHLFEHLMSQGSENVGRGELNALVLGNGGTRNATTSPDRTQYYTVLPANQLELALFLEADRMRALDITQENLDNQRSVVQEERRERLDNQPYGQVSEVLPDLAFTNFAYKHTTIGSMEDLNAATLEDVRAFYQTYYAPNNAAMALAGDFNTGKAKALIAKYFGPIPRRPAPPPVDASEPPLGGEKRRTLSDRLARLPLYVAAYRTVPGNDPDYYALSILADLLGRGRTSRLYPALVEKQIALAASTLVLESRGHSLFLLQITVPPGGTVEAVETAMDAEITRLQAGGISAEELAKAQTRARTAAVSGLQTALDRATRLSQFAVFYDDPDRINTLLPRLQAVTTDDVQRVARQYLTRNNRVVIIAQPAASPAAGGR